MKSDLCSVVCAALLRAGVSASAARKLAHRDYEIAMKSGKPVYLVAVPSGDDAFNSALTTATDPAKWRDGLAGGPWDGTIAINVTDLAVEHTAALAR